MTAAKLGFTPDTVIQELGWDEDVDEELRSDIEKHTGHGLVDCLQDIVEGGGIWLLTPKVGRQGYVENADISEAAPIAGLATTTTSSASNDWAATRLSTPKRQEKH